MTTEAGGVNLLVSCGSFLNLLGEARQSFANVSSAGNDIALVGQSPVHRVSVNAQWEAEATQLLSEIARDDEIETKDLLRLTETAFSVLPQRLRDRRASCSHAVGDEENLAVEIAELPVAHLGSLDMAIAVAHPADAEKISAMLVEIFVERFRADVRRNITAPEKIEDDHLSRRVNDSARRNRVVNVGRHWSSYRSLLDRKFARYHFLNELPVQTASQATKITWLGIFVAPARQLRLGATVVKNRRTIVGAHGSPFISFRLEIPAQTTG